MDIEIEEVPGEPNNRPVGYINDPVIIGDRPQSDRDIVFDIDILEGRFQCNECHNCTPHVVAVYRHSPTGTHFNRYRTMCVNHMLADN
jgi:hypothetical protein